MNLVILPNNSFQKVKVGRIDPSDHEGKPFTVDEDRIVWPRGFSEA